MIRPLLNTTQVDLNGGAAADWGIVTDGDRGLELWQPHWKPRVLGRDDPSPFQVSFVGSRYNRWSIAGGLSLESASQQLLTSIEKAASESDLRGFINVSIPLRKTIELFESQKVELVAFSDALTPSMSQEAGLLAVTAIRTCLVIGSNLWQGSFTKSDVIGCEIAAEVWKSAMVALESAAMAPSKA